MNFEEIMAFNHPYNQRNINSLIEKIQVNSVVSYIGAGMSMLFDSAYPTWSGFLTSTFEQYFTSSDKVHYESLNYEEKAEFLYSEIGRITFADHLKDIFDVKYLDCAAIDFIDKSAYFLPVIFENGLLITTNYDRVIEKIYSLHEKVLTVAHPGHYEALNRALRDGDLLLYKIHGDIAEPETSIILSKEQYETAYANPSLIQALRQAYTSKEMLFLGCSITKDRPIELLCEISTAGMRNYAIIPCKEEDVRDRRLELESDYFTQAIIYPDGRHECLRIILEHIACTVKPQLYQRTMEKFSDKKSVTASIDLTEEWFITQNRVQIKNLGDRYLPDLNVELNIRNVFDALARNERFYRLFIENTDEVLIGLRELHLDSINANTRKIYDYIKEFKVESVEPLRIEDILVEADSILRVIDKKISDNYEKIHAKASENNDTLYNDIYKLNKAHSMLYNYIVYLSSSEICAVNNPYVLLYGEGGIGKSHIIADTIMKRNSDGKRSLLFLGQHFKDNNNPFTDILKMLELECSSDQLLSNLNQIAEENNTRIIVFIDALNEGSGKKIWKDYLAGMVDKFKLFPWIGLVVSIRTEYAEPLFADNRSLYNEFVKVNHKGFSTMEYDAIRKYFEFYNIQFSDIPFAEQEFRNPLFLRLLCEGYKNNRIDLSSISFTDVYKSYLSSINLRISDFCEYSRHVNIVEKVINEMVLYKHNAGLGNNLIPLNNAIDIIIDIERRYSIKKSLLDELLSNGVLTQNTNYSNEEYIYVTYEKLDDYLYAKLLTSELDDIGVEQFRLKYQRLRGYGDILEALAIAMSENAKYELFDIFEEDQRNSNIINAFCNSLKWRKTDTISQKVIDYINNVVLRSQIGFERIFDVLLLISSKVGHSLNAERTVEYILNFPMPNRDATFIPLFDDLYFEEGSSINRLLDWCLSKKTKDNTLEGTVRLAAIMLATFLISSNNTLRDKTTKALVNLLSGKIDILISVLEKYKDVDDPYVIERLYAVAFGCIVAEQKTDKIEALAIYIYDSFFKNEYIYPNMLVRDYAKSIIEYAKYKVSSKLSTLNVEPPYKSELPEVPTDDEIKKYKFDYNAPDFKDYYWSQNAILNSMKVEYDRDGAPGGYGDFGRYTFQSYFSNWNGLNYNDLKNIAIKKIFDMGYDVEKHGEYDRRIESSRYRSDSKERIGKKYQWIALYELAAQVADTFKMEVHKGCYGEKAEVYCAGSYEPNLRNIDPTALYASDNNEKQKKIHKQLYKFSAMIHNEWLRNIDDLPDLNNLVNMTCRDINYILLNGWYIWTEEKDLGDKQYQNPQKDMWIQINCYIVKNESYNETINYLKDKDYIGRWLSEPNDNYHLFNKEYYWSDAYRFYMNPYYCGDEWTEIDKYGKSEGKNLVVLLPSSKYMTERKGDLANDGSSASWYKPCDELFKSLDMRYGKENSVLYDSKGEIICFDSSELLNEDIGLFIDKDSFFKFLEDHSYKAFWTVLAEKRIIVGDHNHRERFKQPRISGVFTVNKEGKITGKTRQFED